MTDGSPGTGAVPALPSMGDSVAALNQMKGLLKAKDDTSRFVGLALLKSVLDNQPLLREDIPQVTALWESISPKFLDRLLRAEENSKISRDEANSMVNIAVAVLHTFAILLPPDVCGEKRFIGRMGALLDSLLKSSSGSSIIILQTLLTLVSQVFGALELLKIEDVSSLTEIAPQQPLVLDIITLAWANAATESTQAVAVTASIDKIIPSLLVSFKGTDAVTLMAFVADTLPKLPREVVPQKPSWLQPLLVQLRGLITSRPTSTGRAAYTEVSAALLQVYPLTCPTLLFKDDKTTTKDAKPFSYLFINLLLIDIRASFPSLLAKLNSPEYPAISKRLCAAFDVVSSFIGFLVQSLGDEPKGYQSINMPPDLLLKLRKDIAETMSLAIEYLRDRWDACVAGASGLDPSARTGTAATSEGSRLTLTWDSIKDNISEDILILASIRCLAIWLREDENENLRNECAALTDMFVELYKANSGSVLDFRYPILTALEGVITTDDGVDGFVAQSGWEVLTLDLASVGRKMFSQSGISASLAALEDSKSEATRGIEIVRVLLAVIDHESTTEPREHWMKVVSSVASIRHVESHHPIIMEFEIAMLQLATALITLAGRGMQKRHIASIASILGLASQVNTDVLRYPAELRSEFQQSLDDIVMELDIYDERSSYIVLI